MQTDPYNLNYVLSLCTRTWVRDSHGLYDYESNQTKNLNAVLAEPILLARKKHDIKTINKIEELQNDEELLFSVKIEDKNYFLENKIDYHIEPSEKNINDLSNKIWYVLRPENQNQNSETNKQTIENKNSNYFLLENDIIKLGRVKYSLNEVHILGEKQIVAPQEESPDSYNIDLLNQKTESVFNFIHTAIKADSSVKEEDRICKICYSEEMSDENPLVHLCKCNGGLRFAHFNCIKKWMETKLVLKENEKKTVKSYNIKSFNCEICKTPYPYKFKVEGMEKTFDLIDIQRPEDKDYIILESLNQMKENCNIKSVHCIQLTDDNITIGRGHESDVRINDISVSRSHACLKYDREKGTLLLKDLKSKFGTLILIKKPLKIKTKKIHLQIGRTYIEAWLMTMEEFENLRKQKMVKEKAKLNSERNPTPQVPNPGNNMEIEDNNMELQNN